eukprot:g24779.t1
MTLNKILEKQFVADLMGSNFFESGQVDSWLDWTSMEVDHLLLETEDISSLLQVLEDWKRRAAGGDLSDFFALLFAADFGK